MALFTESIGHANKRKEEYSKEDPQPKATAYENLFLNDLRPLLPENNFMRLSYKFTWYLTNSAMTQKNKFSRL